MRASGIPRGCHDADYVERRAASLVRFEELRRSIDDPALEVESWRAAVRELVTLVGTLLEAFHDDRIEDRRALVG